MKLINESTKKSDGGSLVKAKQVVSQLPFSRSVYLVCACFGLSCYPLTLTVLWHHLPSSGQEELLRTKARLVRELRKRTLRRQRQLLHPASDSDSDSEEELRLEQGKRDWEEVLTLCALLWLSLIVCFYAKLYLL